MVGGGTEPALLRLGLENSSGLHGEAGSEPNGSKQAAGEMEKRKILWRIMNFFTGEARYVDRLQPVETSVSARTQECLWFCFGNRQRATPTAR